MQKMIHVVPHQHFDIIWRRNVDWYCQKRKELICQAIQLLKDNSDFTFSFSQAAVIREFVENNPEYLADIKQFLEEKRLEIVGGVETVCDLNMVSGEAILKNIEMGRQWFRETLNYEVTVGGFEDAFGISAQLPQMLKMTDYRFYKAGRMPRPGLSDVKGNFVLKGLDQSSIRCISPADNCCDWGWGCSDNPDDPIVPDEQQRYRKVYNNLLTAAKTVDHHCLYVIMGEEHDILERVVDMLPLLSAETGENYRFSSFERYYDSISDSEWEAAPVVDCSETDLSRIFTGCYTSRRNSKLEPKLLETQLLVHELDENCDDGRYTQSWRDLFVMQFHDAICGCHIDENADYLNKIYRRASEQTALQHIELPWNPEIPRFESNDWHRFTPNKEQIQFGDFQIETDDYRLVNVNWRGQSYGALCNLVLREDSGTLWTEEYSGRIFDAGELEIVTGINKASDLLQIKLTAEAPGFREMWPGFAQLTWTKMITIHQQTSIIRVDLELDWLGNSTEIALAWNSDRVRQCRAEIPFGSIDRSAYIATQDTIWGEAFPALNWVQAANYVVFNQGTPGHAIRNDRLESILLRSPVKRWSPWFPVTPSEKSWDNGHHRFSFLWMPSELLTGYGQLHRIGREFNMPAKLGKMGTPISHSIPANIVISSLFNKGEYIELLSYETDGKETCWRDEDAEVDEVFKPYEIKRIQIKK